METAKGIQRSDSPDRLDLRMRRLLIKVKENLDENKFTDVFFKLSNSKDLVSAHRVILSAASPYFVDLFTKLSPFEIKDIDRDIFVQLISFCYTGEMIITLDNVDKMLHAALKMQLGDAVNDCAVFIENNFDEFTLARAYALERETKTKVLRQTVYNYEIKNFMQLIKGVEFLRFDHKKLQKIIKNDSLNVESEENVFEAVKFWYEYDSEARREQLPDLIACLRLTQFDSNFILTNIRPLPGCHLLALEALTWNSHIMARPSLSIKYTRQRKGALKKELLLAVNKDSNEYKAIWLYDTATDEWKKWADIKFSMVENFSVVLMNDNLIFVGGYKCYDKCYDNKVSCWNLKTKSFEGSIPPMNEGRSSHSVVILNDHIYVMGGERDKDALVSAEMYSVSNGWRSIKIMIHPRCGHEAVALDNKIYVIGGWNGNTLLDSVHCYETATDCWFVCANMIEGIGSRAATLHNRKIYVVSYESSSTTTVQRYDPLKNEWTKIYSTSFGVGYPSCISYNNELWIVGENRLTLVYNEGNDKWINKKGIPISGLYHCFAVNKALLWGEIQMSELYK